MPAQALACGTCRGQGAWELAGRARAKPGSKAEPRIGVCARYRPCRARTRVSAKWPGLCTSVVLRIPLQSADVSCAHTALPPNLDPQSLLAHAASPSCLSNRILWRGRGLRLRQYDACMSIRGSDHKPVVALFDLDVKQALAPDALRRVSSPSAHKLYPPRRRHASAAAAVLALPARLSTDA